MKIRVKFRKYGAVRFIGHLDVMRFFQKALRRAEIDVKYTSGFSPHPIMTFASPLGVGLESNGEYMDIECESVTDSQDMKRKLNQASAPGIEVISVKELPKEAGNAMASVAAAEYTIRFREGRMPCLDFSAKIPQFLSQEQVFVEKETKTGHKEVDIRPGIYEMSVCLQEGGGLAIHMVVDASSAGNLKPAKVMEAFCKASGCSLEENALQITREEVFTWALENGEKKLVPLEEIGTDIGTI